MKGAHYYYQRWVNQVDFVNEKNALLCQIGYSVLNLIVREDSWNTYACCGPRYVYFLSSPNNLIVHAIVATYMVSIDYATTKLGCFPITCFANSSLRKCHLPFMDYANRINHSQYQFFWDDIVCWLILIIILMKVGTSNPDARASIGDWLTHLMRAYPMF